MSTSRMNFTAHELESLPLPAPGKRDYVNDTKETGLQLQVTSSGVKTFYLYKKVKGRPERLKLGHFPDMSITQARLEAARIRTSIGDGGDPAVERQGIRAELTLQGAFDLYLEKHLKPRRKRWEDNQKDFDRRVPAAMKKRKLSDISHRQASQLHEDIKTQRGRIAANRTVQQLKAVYNRMIKRERLYKGENPFEGIEFYKEKARKRFLSDDEAGRLLAALDKSDNVDLRDFILLDLDTGARKDNLLSMRFEDIDWQSSTWTIPDTKSGEPQFIGLGKQGMAILRRRKGLHPDKAYVFPGDGRTGHLVDFKRCWTTLRKRLGLLEGNARLTIHDLRRSLASGMASQGITLPIVQGALGHLDSKTTSLFYAFTTQQAQLEGRQQVQAHWQKQKEKSMQEPAAVIPLKKRKGAGKG